MIDKNNTGNKSQTKKNKNEIEGQQTLNIYEHMNVDENGAENNLGVTEIENNSDTEVIEENSEVTTAALDLIKGGNFNAKLFHEQFEDNTEKVLFSLLEMQSNDNPLKKGGNSIAFRCNAIIIQNRQNYTVSQNTLLDVITARMSAQPEDNYYIITAKELFEDLPYTDKKYVYKLMSKACKELNRSPFIFEIELDNGKKKTLEFQWNELLMYNGADNLDDDEDAYISFTPTKFFRILTLSSTIMHGAHFPIGVSAQISTKYARNLFYYLEDMKNFKEYPNATPGIFVMSLDELRYIVKYPDSYRATDIRRYVLDAAVKEINNTQGIDFTFNYELIKNFQNGAKKKITHVKFIITSSLKAEENKNAKKDTNSADEKTPSEDVAPLQVLKGVGLTDDECKDVLKKYKTNKRDLVFLTQAITSVVTTKKVKSKCALLCHIMDSGINSNFSEENNKKRYEKGKTDFHNFEQNDYDYDELEREMLDLDNTEQ